MAVLNRYRTELLGAGVVLVGLLLVLHILRLRAQVRVRTRELEDAKTRAEVEARTDVLTGLPNRRYFLEALVRDIARAERNGTSLSMISMDVDFFKVVNDKYGHAAGDQTLRLVGEALAKHSRTGDIVARIGGEEFALSCLNTNLEETRHLAERVRHEIQSLVIQHEGESFGTTVSIGLAFHEDGEGMEQLLRKADQALYAAKESGRNRVCEWRHTEPAS